MKKNVYSVTYSLDVNIDGEKTALKHDVAGYFSIEAAKDDVDSQIRRLMRKANINKADLVISIVVSDANGNYVDSDEIYAKFDDPYIAYEW